MRVALDVVNHKHGAATLRELIDRLFESRLQIRLRLRMWRPDLARVIDVRHTLPESLYLAQPAQHVRRRDCVQPRRQCRVASKRTESFECPDEGFLGEPRARVASPASRNARRYTRSTWASCSARSAALSPTRTRARSCVSSTTLVS